LGERIYETINDHGINSLETICTEAS